MEVTSGQICEDLLALMKHAKARLFELAETQHLTPVQMSALYAISSGESTMGSVANALHCDASNVTGIIDRLVSQDLVERFESEHDRRAKTLQLTAKGKRAMRTITDNLPQRLGCSKLTREERTVLHGAIAKLTEV